MTLNLIEADTMRLEETQEITAPEGLNVCECVCVCTGLSSA